MALESLFGFSRILLDDIMETYYSTELWYSVPEEPPIAYRNSSITATPTRFRGTLIGAHGLHVSVSGS